MKNKWLIENEDIVKKLFFDEMDAKRGVFLLDSILEDDRIKSGSEADVVDLLNHAANSTMLTMIDMVADIENVYSLFPSKKCNIEDIIAMSLVLKIHYNLVHPLARKKYFYIVYHEFNSPHEFAHKNLSSLDKVLWLTETAIVLKIIDNINDDNSTYNTVRNELLNYK